MRLKAAVVLLVAGCGGSVGDAPELLPDLVQSPPRALEVYRAGDTWGLAFLSAVENDTALDEVKRDVKRLCDQFPLYAARLEAYDAALAAHA